MSDTGPVAPDPRPAGAPSITGGRLPHSPTHLAEPASVLPEFPPGGLSAGLDWATADHAVAVVNGEGTVIEQYLTDSGAVGLRELITRLRRAGGDEVAIEHGDGQVVDALLAAGLTVVVISPNQVHNLRGRYGSAGNKDDRFDACILADTLRTDAGQ